mmetsp:Transcript_26747/g.85790  ORF Transcript_26747/g.85790 Transcript_26747/m.85790 type:complete len:193 (-) Transcript_26747:265-843(-)
MAARFARRAAELEAALERARETISQLETAYATDQKLTRSLRARVAKHERRGGSDFEYLRNVLLRFFLLPPEERGPLFPAIASACGFSSRQIAQINEARQKHAPAASAVGAWLWGSAAAAAEAQADASYFGDGGGLFSAPPPPATPPPPARPPATNGTGDAGDAGELRTKASKLRYLLQRAEAEIARREEQPG